MNDAVLYVLLGGALNEFIKDLMEARGHHYWLPLDAILVLILLCLLYSRVGGNS